MFDKNDARYTVNAEAEEALKLFHRGDGIDDKQLNICLEFYGKLEASLVKLGSSFNLARWEVNRRLTILEGFKRARTWK